MNDQLRKSLEEAKAETLEGIDFEEAAKVSGRDIDELKREATDFLGDALVSFPDFRQAQFRNWLIILNSWGNGGWRVEMNFRLTSGAGMIVDYQEIERMVKEGRIDEHGELID